MERLCLGRLHGSTKFSGAVGDLVEPSLYNGHIFSAYKYQPYSQFLGILFHTELSEFKTLFTLSFFDHLDQFFFCSRVILSSHQVILFIPLQQQEKNTKYPRRYKVLSFLFKCKRRAQSIQEDTRVIVVRFIVTFVTSLLYHSIHQVYFLFVRV